MAQTDSDQKGVGRWIMVERRGRDYQGTCMNAPWTLRTVWGLTVGVRVGGVEEGKGRKIWTNVIE